MPSQRQVGPVTDMHQPGDPDSRVASVKITDGRIEIGLLKHDLDWVDQAINTIASSKPQFEERDDGTRWLVSPVFVIACPDSTA